MNKKSVAVGVYRNPAIQQLLKEGGITSSQLNRIIVEEIVNPDKPEDDAEEKSPDDAPPPEDAGEKKGGERIGSQKMNEKQALAVLAKLKEVLATGTSPDDLIAMINKEGQTANVQAAIAFYGGDEKKIGAAVGAGDPGADVVGVLAVVAGLSGGEASEDPKTVIQLISKILAEAIAAKATEHMVTPILEKISMLGNAASGAGLAAAPASGGSSLFLSLLATAGKVLAVKLAKWAGETAVKKFITWVLESLFDMIPNAPGIDDKFRAIIGPKVWEDLKKLALAGKKEEVKAYFMEGDNWKKIFAALLNAAVAGELGDEVQLKLGEIAAYEIGPEGHGVAVGAMFLALFMDEKQVEALASDKIKAMIKRAEEEDAAEEAGEEAPEAPSNEAEELAQEIEPAVDAAKKTGKEPEREKVVGLARQELPGVVGPETPPADQEKIVQQATDIVLGGPTADDASDEALDAIDPDTIERYVTGLDKFVKEFMEVATLSKQSRIFGGLWTPVREIADTMADESMGKEQAAYTRKVPAAQPPEAAPPVQEEVGDPSPYKDKVINSAKVIQRHVDKIDDVLTIYDKIIAKAKESGGRIEIGNPETAKKYGQQDPKKLLYTLLKMVVQDINEVNAHIGVMLKTVAAPRSSAEKEKEQSGEEDYSDYSDDTGDLMPTGFDADATEVKERLNEAEGKMSRDQKTDMVYEMYNVVKDLGMELKQVLVDTTKTGNTASAGRPAPAKAPAAQPPEAAPPPAGDLEEEVEGTRERDTADTEVGTTAKDLSTKIYEAMQPVKEFFPSANPLQSEYGLTKAVAAFRAAIKSLDTIVSQIQRHATEKEIDPSLLRDFQQKLEEVKGTLIEYFGVSDLGGGKLGTPNNDDVGALNPVGKDQVDSGELEDEATTSKEGPPTDDEEEEDAGPVTSIAQLSRVLNKQIGVDSKIKNLLLKAGVPEGETQQFWQFYAYLMVFKKELELKEAASDTQAKGIIAALGVPKDKVPEFFTTLKTIDKASMEWFQNFMAKAPNASTTLRIMHMLGPQVKILLRKKNINIDDLTWANVKAGMKSDAPVDPDAEKIAAEAAKDPEAKEDPEKAAEEAVAADETVPEEEKPSMVSKVVKALMGIFGGGKEKEALSVDERKAIGDFMNHWKDIQDERKQQKNDELGISQIQEADIEGEKDNSWEFRDTLEIDEDTYKEILSRLSDKQKSAWTSIMADPRRRQATIKYVQSGEYKSDSEVNAADPTDPIAPDEEAGEEEEAPGEPEEEESTGRKTDWDKADVGLLHQWEENTKVVSRDEDATVWQDSLERINTGLETGRWQINLEDVTGGAESEAWVTLKRLQYEDTNAGDADVSDRAIQVETETKKYFLEPEVLFDDSAAEYYFRYTSSDESMNGKSIYDLIGLKAKSKFPDDIAQKGADKEITAPPGKEDDWKYQPDTGPDAGKMEEQLIKKLKPIVERQLRRLNDG